MRFAIALALHGAVLGAPLAAFADGPTSDLCPPADETQGYVMTALRPDVQGEEGALKLYYRTLAPFDAAKRTLLVVNGGPGGDHEILYSFEEVARELDLNVVSFDHRGLGCTKIASREYWPGYEPKLWAIERAASDLHALKEQLLGKDGKWHVYGVSYGGMLAQRYAIDHPGDVDRLILDSTFHTTRAIDVARKQYRQLFVDASAATRALYDAVVAKYPDAKDAVLSAIFPLTYSYAGRVVEIPDLLEKILAAETPAEAQALYGYEPYAGPVGGMSYDIICEEIWDHANDGAYAYYFADFHASCGPYAKTRRPMEWKDALATLPVPTLIWSGVYDPVTPAAIMREMASLIPKAILWENPHAGHGLFWELPDCSLELLRRFLAGASEAEVQKIADGASCQAEPRRDERRLDWRQLTKQRRPSF